MKRSIKFVMIASALLMAIGFISCTKEDEPQEETLKSITLDKTTVDLEPGAEIELKATITPSSLSTTPLKWTSSNDAVATVANGKVKAIKDGDATITVTATKYNKTATCKITVKTKHVAVTSIALNKKSIELEVGAEETLTATITPDDASDKTITWTSDKENIATVENGKIKSIKEGKAVITASAESGAVKETCEVTVKAKAPVVIPVESIEIQYNGSYSITVDDEFTLTVIVKPDNATNKDVRWEASNESLTIDANGKVKAIKKGLCSIKAYSVQNPEVVGQLSNSFFISEKVVDPTEVILSKTSLELIEGSEQTITAEVKPFNATDKTVIWESENNAIATVTDGKIKAIKEGSTAIKATAGKITAKCQVTVKAKEIVNPEPAELEITVSSNLCFIGETITITANKKAQFSTKNTNVMNGESGRETFEQDILTVSEDGKTATYYIGGAFNNGKEVNKRTYKRTIEVKVTDNSGNVKTSIINAKSWKPIIWQYIGGNTESYAKLVNGIEVLKDNVSVGDDVKINCELFGGMITDKNKPENYKIEVSDNLELKDAGVAPVYTVKAGSPNCNIKITVGTNTKEYQLKVN